MCLANKWKVLGSIPSTEKKKKRQNKLKVALPPVIVGSKSLQLQIINGLKILILRGEKR
jgi:hypothetical protein